MPAAPCSPVGAAPGVLDRAEDGARTVVTVDVDEQVFPGHYPGFPIFPGVCIVECVHRSALATAPAVAGAAWRLSAIESTRFLSPVYPGDRLTTELRWSRQAGSWRCTATASTERGPAAHVRLRFETEPTT
ncbi:3-hydroxyacyl-ACP dehydratase FabZ family protein [Streptomyces sp. TS71-3]|uniref:3-hydroxyacyl-ACP dehydratase FabZ family protein n=1 Tax=Streptomyces sp. TS71-3 TaxID=2733862 RepID=UPI001B1046F8|nr:beta-hydroxyacyl-ACP dehydratase [Streptomyces sp. TS71-3]GHJ36851.1 hypothetical protein Sm713_24600 [Streptomyces sp. TS71-3]